MTVSRGSHWGLQDRIVCPHCWERFPPERCLWISTHGALVGDVRIGADQQKRFTPERFSVDGDAFDLHGSPCQDLACPKCHLIVPRACLEMQPIFMSMLGAPGSGKSVFLGAMTAELRRMLVRHFCLSFADADPVMNEHVIGYENALSTLSSGAKHGDFVPIESRIAKTDATQFTDQVKFDSGDVLYPRPVIFTVQPSSGHTNEGKARRVARSVCFYDNAGESFTPGIDRTAQPFTRHLAEAQVLLIVIDPTQDADFQQAMNAAGCELRACEWSHRQDSYIHESARRIRKFARKRETDKFPAPVIVILTKCDSWWDVLGIDRPGDPWVRPKDLKFSALNVSTIEDVSAHCQEKLRSLCPLITNAIEGFASDVIYIPISAAGWSTTYDPETKKPAIKLGAEAQRHWVIVPFLYALRRVAPTLLAEVRRKA
jgi:hypothetical protein